MSDNPRVQRNGGVSNSSNTSVKSIEEAIRRLRVQNDGEQSSDTYPERPGEPDCIHFLRTGMCGFGSSCRFNHPTYDGQVNQYVSHELPERLGEPDCSYYMKTGTCKFGSTCKFNHPRDRHGAGPLMLNVLGLPMRQGEKSCPHYLRTGFCKFGVGCKFHHPQPAADGFPLSIPTALTYVSVPPSGPSPGGGLPAWSLPMATYISDPLLQTPQTNMPLFLSPSQGIIPTRGWNTYVGSLTPISSTGIFGTSGSIEQLYGVPSVSTLPERPDQPECQHYMKTGNCKHGSNCRYHHPKERNAQLTASSLGPLGLPLRPGQDVCSYYSMYGLCKFGPTCRFDHPLVGYSYDYSMSLPSLSIPNPSPFPHAKSTDLLHSSEPSIKSSELYPTKEANVVHADETNPENQPEHAGSPHSSPPSSELPHDQSS